MLGLHSSSGEFESRCKVLSESGESAKTLWSMQPYQAQALLANTKKYQDFLIAADTFSPSFVLLLCTVITSSLPSQTMKIDGLGHKK